MIEIIKALQWPFPVDRHKWRVGASWGEGENPKGIALVYIDARDVMDRLDAVLGPHNWQTEFSETEKGRVICHLSININGQWITKSDGAGDTGFEGEKGAISDALKRAAVQWGIGRYLYSVPSPTISLIKRGKSVSIPDHEIERLRQGLKEYLKSFQPIEPEGFAALADTIINQINAAQTINELKAIWDGNLVHLKALKEYRPDLYASILEAFNVRKGAVA